MTPLGRLIKQAADDPRFGTQGDLARACGITPQTLSRMAVDDPLKTIVPDKLISLARGSGIDLVEIVRAALLSAGLPDLYEDRSLADRIWGDPDLTNESKRIILGALDAAIPRQLRSRRTNDEVLKRAAYDPNYPTQHQQEGDETGGSEPRGRRR